MEQSWDLVSLSCIMVFQIKTCTCLALIYIYRKDRAMGRGGGLLAYVSNTVKCIRRKDLEDDNLEVLWLQVKGHRRWLLIGNVYRAPSSAVTWFDLFESMLDKAVSEGMEMIVLGDFNCNYLEKSCANTNCANLMQWSQVMH